MFWRSLTYEFCLLCTFFKNIPYYNIFKILFVSLRIVKDKATFDTLPKAADYYIVSRTILPMPLLSYISRIIFLLSKEYVNLVKLSASLLSITVG